MIRPPRLTPGDRIALVAPASGFAPDILEPGCAELRRLGFEPVYSQDVFARTRFEAGPAAVRAAALRDAWRDPSVAAILAIRGGYGSQQLLPLLEHDLARTHPKVLIGYSDLTALLCWSCAQGVVSVQGPMVDGRLSRGTAAYDEASLLAAITRPDPMGTLAPDGVEALAEGEATGLVVGGTLSQLVSLLGTPWAFDVPRGAVLCLEDIGERPYRVHRMLTQLAQSGQLARAGALVFGEFPGCDEPGGAVPVRDVIRDFVQGFPGPVLFGFPFGHTAGPQWSLPVGVQGRVTSAPPQVTILEAAVS